jgi:general secretion pathway protein C
MGEIVAVMKRMIPFKNWRGLSNLNFSVLLSWTGRYRTAAILAVITVLSFQSVGIFYKAVSLKLLQTKFSPPVQQAATIIQAAPEPVESYKIVSERNLFGTTDKALFEKQAASRTAAVRPDIADTLEVRGTVAGDARYGFAVIEDKILKKQQLYKVGDRIAGARIVRIMRNAVALRVNGRESIIRTPETNEKPLLPPGVSGTMTPPASSGGSMTISKDDITAGLKDMGTMLSQAVVRPNFTGGLPDGFTVSNIKSGSIYQKIGLMDGDVIQGVNNRKLTSGDDMIELYNSLKAASGMSLKVKRQGRQENFNYIFK